MNGGVYKRELCVENALFIKHVNVFKFELYCVRYCFIT